MPWYRRGDGSLTPGDKKEEDIEFKPEELKKDINESVKAALEEIETKRASEMKPIHDMVSAINKDREDRANAAAKLAAEKKKEENQVSDEDFLLDPAGATAKAIAPTNNAVYMLAARQARSEVLGDKEYYYGDVKNEVDKMIQLQPLARQSDVSLIENCYKLVMYDKQKDIADGKLKIRNNSASFQSNGTGAPSAEDKNKDEDWSKEEENAAKSMGFSKKEWITSRKELTYV
jgi:hypothetical protein